MKEYVVGIDVGGTNIRVGLMNSKLEILKKETALTKQFETAKDFIKHIKAMIDKVNVDKKADTVGIVLPVPWMEGNEKITDATTVPFLENVKYEDIKKELLGYDVHFENDVNVIAFLEANVGGAVGYENSIYITVSTGIGSGVIIGNQIYHGANGYAGEIGRIPLYHSKKGRQVFEDLCSGTALLEESNRLYGKDANKSKKLFDKYQVGDAKAVQVIEEWKEMFSDGLAATLQMLDPGVVVLGGPVIINHAWIVEELIESTSRKLLDCLVEKMKIVTSQFGIDAGLLGAGYYALECQKRSKK